MIVWVMAVKVIVDVLWLLLSIYRADWHRGDVNRDLCELLLGLGKFHEGMYSSENSTSLPSPPPKRKKKNAAPNIVASNSTLTDLSTYLKYVVF